MAKTVAITGAGGALAEAVIPLFEQEGWDLALLAHGDKAAKRLSETYGSSLVLQADLSREEATRGAFGRILETYSRLDALVNLAGGFALSSAAETSKEDLEKQLTLNFKTAFNATRAALPGMLKQGTGIIVGIGAKPAQGGAAKMGPYAASKAALVTYLESVRAELAPRGVTTSLLYPMGTIDTPANRESMPDTDPESWIAPEELAQSLLHLVNRGPRGRVHELRVYPPA